MIYKKETEFKMQKLTESHKYNKITEKHINKWVFNSKDMTELVALKQAV